MILTIFKKIIKDKKASVEIIESSLIYPFMMISLSFLFIISILTINKAFINESIYNTNRNLVVNVENDYELIKKLDKEFIQIEEKSLNERISSFTSDKPRIKVSENIFNIKVTTSIDDKNYINSKIYVSDTLRKSDFIKDIIKDNNINISYFSIKNGLKEIEKLEEVIKTRY